MESKEGRKTSINDGWPEILKMKYRIAEPGTPISGFAENDKTKILLKMAMNTINQSTNHFV
jgi:hypothetical protein